MWRRPLDFDGIVPASKSMLNRAIVIRSFDERVEVRGASDCDDVRALAAAIRGVGGSSPLDCGEGGTVLRFLAARVSRLPEPRCGVRTTLGSPR